MSDYDFAILLDHGADALDLQAQLTHRLRVHVGAALVDVILLNQITIELAHAVIAQGKLLYQRDVVTRVEYEAQVMSRYGDYLPVLCVPSVQSYWEERIMTLEFSGIERRLDELNERLARLYPLQSKARTDFDQAPYLRDIVERNLEVAIQCCIDISHRIIAIEQALKPNDYYEAILRMGELGVLPPDFARQLAPITGFRNILIHEYLNVDWTIEQ